MHMMTARICQRQRVRARAQPPVRTSKKRPTMLPSATGIRLRLCLRRLGQAQVRLTLRCTPSNVNLPDSTLQLTGAKCDKFSVDDRRHLNFLSREFTTKYGSNNYPMVNPVDLKSNL